MFDRKFFGIATLIQLQNACMDVAIKKTADLVEIEGRNAQLPDGSQSKINVVRFDPKDDESEVRDDLRFVKKADATVAFIAQMASEGRAQIGGDMDVFIEDKAETILVFGKTTLVIHTLHN